MPKRLHSQPILNPRSNPGQTISPYSNRSFAFAFLAVVGIALVLRLLGLGKSIWLDDQLSMYLASQHGLSATLRTAGEAAQLPSYFLLLKFWLLIDSHVEFIRLLSVAFSLGMVIVTILCLKLYSKWAAVLAGVAMATTPIMLRYSQEIRDYGLLLLATSAAFYFASRIAADPGTRWGYIGLAATLLIAVTTHFIGGLVIAPIAIFLLMMSGDLARINIKGSLLAVAIPGAVFLFVYLLYRNNLPSQSTDWWMPHVSLELVSAVASYEVGFPALEWYANLLQERLAVLGIAMVTASQVLLFGTFALAGVFGKWRRSAPFLVAAACYWIQILGYSIFVTPILWYRTALPGLVPFIGFIALQIATIQLGRMRLACAGVLLMLFSVFASYWAADGAWRPIENWSELFQALGAKWRPPSPVVLYPNYIDGLGLYYFPSLPSDDVIPIPPGAPAQTIETDLGKTIAVFNESLQSSTVFLVIRYDTSKLNHDTMQRLFNVLKRDIQKPFTLQVGLIVPSEAGLPLEISQTREELLANLAQNFGAPSALYESDSIIWGSYERRAQ